MLRSSVSSTVLKRLWRSEPIHSFVPFTIVSTESTSEFPVRWLLNVNSLIIARKLFGQIYFFVVGHVSFHGSSESQIRDLKFYLVKCATPFAYERDTNSLERTLLIRLLLSPLPAKIQLHSLYF